MNAAQFDFKSVNRYVPHILIIGVAIGTANYALHGEFNWLQWVIQSMSTSFIIGYTLVGIASHKSWFLSYFKPWWKLYLVLALAFFAIGALASEVEQIIKSLLFLDSLYQAFSGGSIYWFNGIISMAMGFSFFLNRQLFPIGESIAPSSTKEDVNDSFEESSPIAKVPVKKGESIMLIPAQEIAYFEAYDNYSFLYNVKGDKMLCDYSLIFLEKRLDNNFMRVHRKHIVNTTHIQQIKPHLNGRYLIEFENLETITSSKSYLASMRKLTKIE